MMMRLYNKTSHVLTIKKGISIAPKGSLVRDLEYSDHIKRLERNGFLAVTVYPNQTEQKSVESDMQNTGDSGKKSSRKTSKDTVEVVEETPAENN